MATVPKTMFLLGAGASVRAGVPTAGSLTDKLVEAVNEGTPTRLTDEARALNAVVGAILAHDTAAGARVTDQIEVERLFSAILMLADRQNLEIAPFIDRWIAAVDEPMDSPALPPFFEEELRRAFGGVGSTPLDARAVSRVIAGGLGSLTVAPQVNETFKRLSIRMERLLATCLAFEAGRSDYLQGCFARNVAPIAIATLNYDLTLEEAAHRLGVPVDYGLTNWRGGLEWQWSDVPEAVRLLKLHGSINWQGGHTMPEGRPSPIPYVEVAGRDTAPPAQPSVIFGRREKLRDRGPFLAMYIEFDRLVRECDRLVIIGYSFRDGHVNAVIDTWMNQRPEPHLLVIDPGNVTARTEQFYRCKDSSVEKRVPYSAALPEFESRDLPPIVEHWKVGAEEGLEHLSELIDFDSGNPAVAALWPALP